jgi:hypothetical protein
MYSMKSAYDQVISNMGRQLQTLHNRQQNISELIKNIPRDQLPSPIRQTDIIDTSQYNKVEKDAVKLFKEPHSAKVRGEEGTGGSTNVCKHCQGLGQVKSTTSISDRPNSTSNRGTERVVINLETYNKTGNDNESFRNTDSYRKMYAQYQKLTEENKKIQSLGDENSLLRQKLEKSENTVLKTQKQLAQTQSLVHQHEQLIKEMKQLQFSTANRRSQSLSLGTQTPSGMLTEKELTLLVQLQLNERKTKKLEKEKTYNANKISKFIYFFFTLQNKGIPVNEIYEKDGVKFIKTDRFQEIMGQNGGGEMGGEPGEANDKDSQYSFYSDDSFEYVVVHTDVARASRFKNI